MSPKAAQIFSGPANSRGSQRIDNARRLRAQRRSAYAGPTIEKGARRWMRHGPWRFGASGARTDDGAGTRMGTSAVAQPGIAVLTPLPPSGEALAFRLQSVHAAPLSPPVPASFCSHCGHAPQADANRGSRICVHCEMGLLLQADQHPALKTYSWRNATIGSTRIARRAGM